MRREDKREVFPASIIWLEIFMNAIYVFPLDEMKYGPNRGWVDING